MYSLKISTIGFIVASLLGLNALTPAFAGAAPLLSVPTSAPVAKNMPPLIVDTATLTPAEAGIAPYCIFTKNLHRGMHDTQSGEIKSLQTFFMLLYGVDHNKILTGYFGPLTQSFVERFQKEQELPVVGQVGPLTRAAIAKACPQDRPVGDVSITSPKGDANFAIGDIIHVTWTTDEIPDYAGMYLQLAKANGEGIVKSVTVPFASGTADIETGAGCNGNFSDALFGDCHNLKEMLKDGTASMKIFAVIYTPKDYCFGFCVKNGEPTILARGQSATFHMTNPDTQEAFLLTKPKEGETYSFGGEIPISWTVRNDLLPKDVGLLIQLFPNNSWGVVKSVAVPPTSGSSTITTKDDCNGEFSATIDTRCENLKTLLSNGQTSFTIRAALFYKPKNCPVFCYLASKQAGLYAVDQRSISIIDPDASFTATSTKGKAPLTTTFTISQSGDYRLSFGDNADDATIKIPSIVCIKAPCNPPPQTVTHIYKKPGTYPATLFRTVKNACLAEKSMVCPMWYSKEENIGEILIDVTDPKQK